MKRYNIIFTLFLSLVLVPLHDLGAVDFTPTDGGLVVNLKPGDQILLSTWVDVNGNGVEDDGEEFFVCHYPDYTGGYFGYNDNVYYPNGGGNYIKLIPQAANATEPATPSIWSIDDPVTFKNSGKEYEVDGIAYTMWSTNPGGDSYTLLTAPNTSFKYQGHLTREQDNANICNAVFVVPTNRSTVTSFDPNKTLNTSEGRTQDAQGRFNGEKGYGFLGLPYSEVYWLDIPRGNAPVSYVNASVIGFNKTLKTINYSKEGNKYDGTALPGQALYAFGNKAKHNPTPRTIFRLYVLNDPLTSTCADSYFFAYDEQDYKQYNKDFSKTPATYTTKKKTYTIDRLVCMDSLPGTKYYVSDWMFVPESDSTYYYVGYKNKYCHSPSTGGTDAFDSQFKQIDNLKIQYLGLSAPKGAYGQMIVDTTQTDKQNLGVEFTPGGYFLRTNTGRNIQLRPNEDRTVWTCEEMWHITAEYAALTIKATMFTGSEYSAEDPGADIPGWSKMIHGTDVPVIGAASIINQNGWARIHVNSTDSNGHLEFVLANPDRHIHYNNNGCVGDTIADQYPMYGQTKVAVREARLVKGFTFDGWTLNADGSGHVYQPGDSIDLPLGTTTLYAKATYTGTIHVALSFKKADGKRYFVTHPGTATPRFSHARYINDWTDAYQGMANAENVDDRYVNTWKVLTHPSPCAECAPEEVVLDPRREMRYGAVDSLLFYENFAPDDEEYLGLYYTNPNTLLANNTWAGLFKSSATGGRNGWPDYTVADVQNAKLSSTHYLHRVAGEITRDLRSNSDKPWITYDTTEDQFDGEASEANATIFQISRVRVADEHYVVIPDTTTEWTDEIVFGIHQDEHIQSDVWSKLIGKQLMAMTKLDDDTIYFHPNHNNIITDATQMRLNAKYRLEESFEYIRDSRVESLGTVDEEYKPHMSDRLEKNYFGRRITSGISSPMDVIYNGNYIDIVDTLRITLRTLGPVKIKEYYGRWKEGAPGLHIRPDGSRYRDIIVRTKTIHHGPTTSHLVLTPEYPIYNFNPLAGDSKRLTFTLAKVSARQLLDTEGNVLGEEILSTEDVTSSLHLRQSDCSFQSGGTYFNVVADATLDDHVTLMTKADNSSGVQYDTLLITSSATVGGESYPVTGRIPLMQTALADAELIWSAVANGQRYFIMAGSEGLIFRRFEQKGNTLYKKEDGKTQLVKGSADAANSDTKYITPWRYTFVNQGLQQLTLRTEYTVNKDFIINGSSKPDVADDGAATLTYEYVNTYINDNANFEEQVKLKYGSDKWLQLTAPGGVPALTLTTTESEATVFSWTYLQREYNLLNNGAYPSVDQLAFGYNSTSGSSVTTRYKAYRIYSMLLGNTLTYCGREDESNITNLTSGGNDWKTNYAINIISDSRFAAGTSGLSKTINTGSLTTTVTPSGDSPMNIRYPAGTGPFVDIVDTLDVQILLKDGAPTYRFAGDWASYKSVDDAHLKIPLIRHTYHSAPYDSLVCIVDRDEYFHVFPPVLSTGVNDEHTFVLHTDHRTGTNILNVANHAVAYSGESHDHTSSMDFTNPALAEIRLIDEKGNTPDWCEIKAVGTHSITVRCKSDGMRSPRSANIYLAYAMQVDSKWRYINFRLQVMQSSRFQLGNQNLVHSKGASGEDLKDGVQQVHENRNILYYYNPSNTAQSTDQRVELPVRERNMYGWWRWYSLQPGEEDTDIPDEKWETRPANFGKYNFPFRIIGGKVPNPKAGLTGEPDSIVVTQGRYTVFHVSSYDYNARKDPPSKAPMVYPPQNKDTVKYAVDLSVYYDNLPLSMKNVNQVDTAVLDTMKRIIEPTLSLREIYELHPWTEMAARMENYKSHTAATYPMANEHYLEDHVVRAPVTNRLLLKTEQRYNYDNVKNGQHSESLLGYYMRDDNWSSMSNDPDAQGVTRQDTMIWCGGWDAPCQWFTYNHKTGIYTTCNHTVTEANDFLQVPKKGSIVSPTGADTVIYCLRARSRKSSITGPDPDEPDEGDYWFNICRYMVIYHNTDLYGPKLETNGVAIKTNDEIANNFEVLERLNFDYNKPGSEYTVYPHPLPWEDASYGFAYPRTAALPDNRPHNHSGLTNLANMGEYNLINRIPSFGTYWHKMEQHGGAENGYMIFCDGMSSAGQVAALSLESHLCEGQRLYFSAYVGNPGNETGKSCPNFLFSVQGKEDKVNADWEDITSYLTGDLAQSNKWYQIFFPIEQNKEYARFRVRVYNMASNDDGNDFIIDDMCIFATKPPLMVYQANTTCKNENESDSLTHVVLRVDYQGFTEDIYAAGSEYYTVEQITKTKDTTFVKLEDGYYNETIIPATPPSTKDTIYGRVDLPNRHYKPREEDSDSVFPNLQELIAKFERTLEAHEAHVKDPSKPDVEVFRQGYIFEHLDDSIRPVLYVIHSAKMASQNEYVVHMAGQYKELLSSRCALTRSLRVRNRMILTLNGEEQTDKEVADMCSNASYDVSLNVKGTVLLDNQAPIEVTGSCYNDWLLYGDTTKATSETTYGYTYSDVEKVIKDILRAENEFGAHPNANRLAHSLAEVSSDEMDIVKRDRGVELTTSDKPYVVLSHLVNSGLLKLYQPMLTIITVAGETVKYTIFPIPGTGSEVMQDLNIDVCPTPVHISLTASSGSGVPLIIGGLNRTEEESQYPITILADVTSANSDLAIPIDSLMMKPDTEFPNVALKQVDLLSTTDPEYREGVHIIALEPDKIWNLEGDNTGYYKNGNDTIHLSPATATNYSMREGYTYTFGIQMMTSVGESESGDCPIGTIPFVVSVVPNRLRWDPLTSDNRWNNPDNWIGIAEDGSVIHSDARYAPLPSSYVVIPPMTDGKPYPVLVDPTNIPPADSIQQVGFQYNTCHSIRFLSGAALNQQQRLVYDSVIADLSMPQQKWALRAAPVTGLLSGDIFMANADLTDESSSWEVGEFDAAGRSYKTGNASFWLSLYSQETIRKGNNDQVKDSTMSAAADWSPVTNGLTLPLQPTQGFAIYARTESGATSAVRLPKHDDIYYYYTKSGDKDYNLYESGLQAKRDEQAGGSGKAGKLAYQPKAGTQSFTLTNGKDADNVDISTPSFVFGNPTMGFIDIWGFIADNSAYLNDEIEYLDGSGTHHQITKSAATDKSVPNTLDRLERYLPPMHAMILKLKSSAHSLTVTLNTNRIVTEPVDQSPAGAPRRIVTAREKGIMTIIATNSVSPRCVSYLLLGQGYNDAIQKGEDAVLTTINIDNFNMTSYPTTPFNLYAVEEGYGLSINLREEIELVPLSFCMSDLPYDSITALWFTGVNNIDGKLFLYDALTDIERPIMDGICLTIETPAVSHERRYYIRRVATPDPEIPDDPIVTGVSYHSATPEYNEQAVKIMYNGHVLILRNGHVYTIFGQQLR